MSLPPSQTPTQFQFDTSTPPPPPPKSSQQFSSPHSRSQSQAGPPLPPPPQAEWHQYAQQQEQQYYANNLPQLPPGGWLPANLKDKSTSDLQHILQTPDLQHALIQNPETTHPSILASTAPLNDLLTTNLALAQTLQSLESQLSSQRQATQSRLLSLRAVERQWRAKQAEQDNALQGFSAPALYQRLNAAVGEQEQLCRGLEESFLDGGDGDGQATEREVVEFTRRLREGRRVAWLRRERKERWDEGRVAGMRG